MGKKVVLAMSGGVDSSVALGLLKDQGYEVTGVMLRLWSESGREDSNRCCTPRSQEMARRVAAHFDIPFFVIDAREYFYSTVVQSFLNGYAQGLTPNPCLICNRQIKWDFLLKHAVALGADFLATGHYARKREMGNGSYQLLRAIDRIKDQSYVLHVLGQVELSKALFPVGDYTKPEIREFAGFFGLSNATSSDSQDLCFLAGEDYREFLHRNFPEVGRPGPIKTRQGKTIGEHQGLAFYTIGQRKGLGITFSVPLYVLSKDVVTNTLFVGVERELGSLEMDIRNPNWISGEAPAASFRATVKTRYTAKEAWADVTPQEHGESKELLGNFHVHFDKPQRDITPGQAAVFYDGDLVLGGGTII
jgi:tRNA-specific 2-thiouridylase